MNTETITLEQYRRGTPCPSLPDYDAEGYVDRPNVRRPARTGTRVG